MDELPYLPIVDPDAALGQFRHKPAQREVTPGARQQPVAMLAPQETRLVTADLPRRHAAGRPIALHPLDRARWRHSEPRRRRMSRQTVPLHRRDHPLAQVV